MYTDTVRSSPEIFLEDWHENVASIHFFVPLGTQREDLNNRVYIRKCAWLFNRPFN